MQTEHLLEHMSDGYFLLDSDWKFSDINDRGRLILEASEEPLGRNIWDVFPDSVGTDYQVHYEKAVQTQQPVKFEVHSPRLEKWFEVRAIPLPKVGLSVFFNDITSRKHQEDLQAAAAERLEMALEASQLGMWEWVVGEKRLSFSDRALWIFGLNPDNHHGNFFSDFLRFIHPEDLKILQEATQTCISSQAPHQVEFRIVWPDGSVHWVQCRGRTIYDSASQLPLRMLGTVIDITARKKHQDDLQKALSEAKSASDLKSAFLANMSHEIRTPLGAILGFAEILADPGTTENDRGQFASIIERNGRILSRLIDDILDLSKVESGHLQLENVSFSLRKTIEAFWPTPQLSAASKSLPLELSIDPQTSDQIMGDPTRWTQILLNLLQNAIKFTERGQVRLDVFEAENRIHFQITDTGIGISAEQKAQLFFAFRQADESITRRYGGTGLGLALSKKLAHLLGGDIQLLESQLGSGSRFLVTLPIQYKKPQSQTRVF